MSFLKSFFKTKSKDIEAAIDLLGNSRTREQGIQFFHDKTANKVIPIIKRMVEKNERSMRIKAVKSLGEIGRRYGWIEIVPILENIIVSEYQETLSNKYHEKNMSGPAMKALCEALHNSSESPILREHLSINPMLPNEIERSVDRINDILTSAASREDYTWSGSARSLLKQIQPELLVRIEKEKEISKIGEENYNILNEAREAAKKAMKNVPSNENALLLLYMKVISRLGEERIDELYFGLNEEHIMQEGANEFQRILLKYGIDSSNQSRLD